MIVFRNIFCYAGWKSLHIPIAIIKLSGLNVFIYSVEGVGPRNVWTECFDWLSYLPVNICICIPLLTRFAQTGYVISAFTYAMQTELERQANINNLTFLPGIVVLLLTVLLSFLTGEWHMMYCSNVVSGILVCERICVQEAWLWMAICREGGTFAFSAIRLKLAFSEISYCTFKQTGI